MSGSFPETARDVNFCLVYQTNVWYTRHKMRTRRHIISRPLDIVLSVPSHIAILRALKDVREGLSGREIARRTGFNHQTIAESLGRLEIRGIVHRLGAGRNQLFRLNRASNLVREVLLPLLTAEQKQYILMQDDLAGVVSGHCLSAVIFGSAARGEETAASDLDILLIVEKKTPGVQEIVRALVRTGMESWGIRVSPIAITRSAFIRRATKGDDLVSNVLNEGVVLWGKNPRAFLR